MAPDYRAHDLDLELVFDRFLDGDAFEILAQRLRGLLPSWSRDLRVWRSRQEPLPIDLRTPASLGSAVTTDATARGELYHRLVERSGPPVFDRRFGSAELRGSSPALTMVISIDEMVASPMGPRTALGNRVVFQVRRSTIERRPSDGWVHQAFVELCGALAPAWASAQHPGEYWAKVMSERPSIQAIGRDVARYLPGLFWLNGFGRPYADLVGEQTLITTPATDVVEVEGAILIVRGESPYDWSLPATRAIERRIVDHLGADLFFDRSHPDRPGRAPAWATPSSTRPHEG